MKFKVGDLISEDCASIANKRSVLLVLRTPGVNSEFYQLCLIGAAGMHPSLIPPFETKFNWHSKYVETNYRRANDFV